MPLTPPQKKAALWIGVGLAIVALLVGMRACGSDADAAQGPGGRGGGPGGGPGGRGGGSDTLVATVALIRQEPVEDAITTTGQLLADEEVEVRAQVAGRITALNFREGAAVGRGQVLAVLDTEVLEAQIGGVRTRRDLAATQAARQRQLFEIGGLSRAALDAAEGEVRVLNAQLSELNAQVSQRRIVAPFAGVIGLRNVSVGAFVSPGDPIATLRVASTLKLEFTVPELYLGRVGPGTAVVFTVPGQERTFRATVYAVEAAVSEATRAFTVRARLPNPGGLAPGAFAEVEVILGRDDDALVVPAGALVPGVDSASVVLVRGGRAQRRSVAIGLRERERVQVRGAVAAGDTVLTSGMDTARPGQPVRALPVAAPAAAR